MIETRIGRAAAGIRRTERMIVLCLVFAVPVMQGCGVTGAVVGAGATAGVVAAQERPVAEAVSDTRIQVAINEAWLRHSIDLYRRMGLMVNEGRVLVAGIVPTQEMRTTAVDLARRVDGVREVIDEVRVAPGAGLSGLARDTWISTQLRLRLTFDREVSAIDYSVETVGGVVFLMGIARSDAELRRVIDHARSLRYVRRVVSHVRIADTGDATTDGRTDHPGPTAGMQGDGTDKP